MDSKPLPDCPERMHTSDTEFWCDRRECWFLTTGLECRRCRASGGRIVTAAEWRDASPADRQRIAKDMRHGD